MRTVRLSIKVIPQAPKTTLAGCQGEWIRIKLTAPPVEGKANKALVEFLARQLSVPKNHITLVAGEAARMKIVQVEDCAEHSLKAFLAKAGWPG